MQATRIGVLALVVVLLGPPVAAEDPLADASPWVETLEEGAAELTGSLLGFSEEARRAVQPLVDLAPSAPGQPGAGRASLVVVGQGAAHQVGINGTCEGMHMVLEWHQPVSQESNLLFNGMAGKGAPLILCSSGWRNSFKPYEVHGDPEHGIVVDSDTIDAITDLTLSAKRPDGTRDLWIHQVTFPNGLGHVLEFRGTVRDL